ncbi:hypothetical protein [Sphingomonas koreensis]
MFNLFAKKPVAASVETVTLAYHRSVVDALKREVSGLTNDVRQAERAYEAANRNYETEKHRAREFGRLNSELLGERDAARSILREIDGMVTPGCAGIGRKMARAAREGLPEYAAINEDIAA